MGDTAGENEYDRLTQMVGEVSTEMLLKLHRQASRGYHGWDDPRFRSKLGRMIREHVERASDDPEQWIDVANFAAMLWHGRKANR